MTYKLLPTLLAGCLTVASACGAILREANQGYTVSELAIAASGVSLQMENRKSEQLEYIVGDVSLAVPITVAYKQFSHIPKIAIGQLFSTTFSYTRHLPLAAPFPAIDALGVTDGYGTIGMAFSQLYLEMEATIARIGVSSDGDVVWMPGVSFGANLDVFHRFSFILQPEIKFPISIHKQKSSHELPIVYGSVNVGLEYQL